MSEPGCWCGDTIWSRTRQQLCRTAASIGTLGDAKKILTDPAKVQLVMKDGVIHKDCATPVPHEAALHLPGADRPLQEEGVKEARAAGAH